MELFGQIDLTQLGTIVRNHPDCIKTVNFKDGSAHQMLNINISERREPDQYGRTHYIKAGIRKDQQRADIKYYVADLKPSQSQSQKQQPVSTTAQQPAPMAEDAPLPF